MEGSTIDIAGNLRKVKEEIPKGVRLVAVSKTRPPEDLKKAYDNGQRIFGENKIQELVYKHECLPADIEWHMIGHLQTNKVKYIAGFIHLIHSVDSLKLLKEINKEARKNNRVVDCLLQVKIAKEDTKFGLNETALRDIFMSDEFKEHKNVRIVGLMGMASYTDNIGIVRSEFRLLKSVFNTTKSDFFSDISYFRELSMGMSYDFPIAIEEGATLVRIGSRIFGKRTYI